MYLVSVKAQKHSFYDTIFNVYYHYKYTVSSYIESACCKLDLAVVLWFDV